MSILKRFLIIFCMTTILIFVGCGSDKSENSISGSSNGSNSSVQKWWFNADNFISRYNSALDTFSKKDKRNYDLLKIVKINRNQDNMIVNGVPVLFQLKLYNSGNSDNENFQLTLGHQLSARYVNLSEDSLINDENICEILYMGQATYDSLHWVILRATLLAFPQFDDLDYTRLNNELNQGLLVTLEHNGLQLLINPYNDGSLMFYIRDIATQKSIDDYRNQQILSAGEANKNAAQEKRKAIAPRKLFNPANPPQFVNMFIRPPYLSLGRAGLGNTHQEMVQALDIYDRTGTESIPRKRWSKIQSESLDDGNYEYRDIIVTICNNSIYSLISCSDILETEKGIREGSTLQQVVSAYGKRCAITNSNDATIYEYPYENDEKFAVVRFIIKNDVVDCIMIQYITDSNEKNRIISSVKSISPSSTGTDTIPTTQTTTLTSSNLSVGGINTGASVNQMHKVLGKEKEIRKSQNTPGNFYYEYNDVVVCVNGDKVISVATYTNIPQTEKGIRQGDSLNKVFSTYGRVCSVEHFDDLTLYEYPFELERGNYSIMRFAIKNDTIEYVSLRIVDSNEFNKISSAKRTL